MQFSSEPGDKTPRIWQLVGLGVFIAGIICVRFGQGHSDLLQVIGLVLIAGAIPCFLLMQRALRMEKVRMRKIARSIAETEETS